MILLLQNFWIYQILQMLNDSNHGVREAAILCIEVSNLLLNNSYIIPLNT